MQVQSKVAAHTPPPNPISYPESSAPAGERLSFGTAPNRSSLFGARDSLWAYLRVVPWVLMQLLYGYLLPAMWLGYLGYWYLKSKDVKAAERQEPWMSRLERMT